MLHICEISRQLDQTGNKAAIANQYIIRNGTVIVAA
jgi:hypothetical protein